MNCVGPGTEPSSHDSAERALLPRVVFVGVLVCGSKSHGERDAWFETTRWQSAAFGLWFQHHSCRLSVLGLFQGNASSVAGGGVSGNVFQRARYGCGGAPVSALNVPGGGGGATGGGAS